MKSKHILLITLVCLAGYANTFFNDFVGDDEVVIVKNDFYRTWKNFPLLFSRDYLTNSDVLYQHTNVYKSSGSVAYRPVLSATYFFDRGLWGLNPFGYHFTNWILHLLNALLVYILIFNILKDRNTALFGGLLFSLHPVQAEAVNAIGYRADPLSAFFVLASFLLFLRFREHNRMNSMAYISSLACYFLALFTKESAIVLPLFILLSDILLKEEGGKGVVRALKTYYPGYILVTVFYLGVYFFAFPNTSLPKVSLLGGSVLTHVISVLWIFAQYLIHILLPFTVKIIPPLYAPPIQPWLVLKLLLAAILAILYLLAVVNTVQTNRPAGFFLLWFLLGLIPVANIIPIANPMAHRFLYLPSVGLIVILAMLIMKLGNELARSKKFHHIDKIIPVSVLALCFIVTFFLNKIWANNLTVAKEIIEEYPSNSQGYQIAGIELLKRGDPLGASEALGESIRLGVRDPKIFYMAGLAAFNNTKMAERYFQKAIVLQPEYVSPYIGLGRLYLFNKQYKEAIVPLEKSLDITPTYSGGAYLIQAHILSGQLEEAREVLEVLQQNIKSPQQLHSLRKLIEERRSFALPVDVGI